MNPTVQKKYKTFTRRNVMDMAKTIRNTHLSANNKEDVGKALAKYLETQDPFFDYNTFMCIVTGKLAYDVKTEPYSPVKDKSNEQV